MQRYRWLILATLVLLAACGTTKATRSTSSDVATTTPAPNVAATQTRTAELGQVAALTTQVATLGVTVPTSPPVPTRPASPTSAPTATVRPSPTVPPKIDLAVQNVTGVPASSGSVVYFYGELVNNGITEVGDIQIAVSLLGDTGQTLASGRSISIGGSFLKPGAKTVWKVYIGNAPVAWKEQRIQAQGGPVSSYSRESDYPDLKVDGATLSPPKNQFSGVSVAGQVINTGQGSAQLVNIVVGFYDDAGKLLSVADGYAKLDQIPPGTSAPFSVESFDVKLATKFVAYVRGGKVR